MKIKILLFFLTGLMMALVCGCQTLKDEDDKKPWTEPADWEGTIPGFPTIPH